MTHTQKEHRSKVMLAAMVLVSTACCRVGFDPPLCDQVDCPEHHVCVQVDRVARCIPDTDPCDGIDCSGHGNCAVTADGDAICACLPGYRNDGPTVCVRDPDARCTRDEDCDDGLFCTLTDTCSAGTCVSSGDSCPGEMCDELADECVECLVGADCGSGECVGGMCCPHDVLVTTGEPTVGVGVSYTLNLAACGAITSWTINWGDGTVATFTGNPSSVTHTYSRAGFTYNILASVVAEGTTILQNELLVASIGTDNLQWYDNTGGFLRSLGPDAGLEGGHDPIIGPDGNIYVGGWRSGNVVRYDGTTGAFIDEFVVAGSGGLAAAVGLAFGPNGNLYVASSSTSEVLRYDGTTGAFIDAFVTAGLGGLNEAEGLVFGQDGNLYVSDYANNAVYRYEGSTGAFIDVFVSSGLGGLDDAEDLTFGPDGNLYVSSERTHEVLRYDGTSGAFMDAFVASRAGGLNDAQGLAFGPEGHLYVTGWSSRNVLRFDGATGAYIDEYVGTDLNDTGYLSFIPGHQVTVLP